MNRSATILLQIITVVFGLVVLALMLWEPHLEGRNVNATLFEIYFKDPFLAYAYISSLAFFAIVYQSFKLAGNLQPHRVRTIKHCAGALILLIAAPLAYLVIVRPEDDIAGGVAMGLFLILVSAAIAVAAAVLEKRLLRKN